MNTFPFQVARRLLAVFAAAMSMGQLAVAQDMERPIAAPDPRQILIGRPGFRLSTSGSASGIDEIRERYESALKSRVERTGRLYGLSEDQKKKLQLAGRGEIKRLIDRTIEARKKTPAPAGEDSGFLAIDLDDSSVDVAPSRELFGEGSLFAKILKNVVTKEQSERYEKVTREASLRHHRATLEWVLATWDQMLGLNPEQHRRLEALLIQQTRPPRRFGAEDYFGVMFQLSRLSEVTLKPLFSEDQWAKLSVQLAEAKRKEAMLKKNGYVPENDVAAAPAGTNEPSANREKEQG